jgi:hypothetical protein
MVGDRSETETVIRQWERTEVSELEYVERLQVESEQPSTTETTTGTRFKILTAMSMTMTVFWVAALRSPARV